MKHSTKRASLDAGDVVAIPLPNGRFVAIWITEYYADFDHKSFFLLDGHWEHSPVVNEPQPAKYPYPNLLPGKDDSFAGSFVGPVPDDFVVVSRVAISDGIRARAAKAGPFVYQNAEHVRSDLYKHWRRVHDRDAFLAEIAARDAEAERERARKAEERKANNSLPNMLGEKPFAHWRDRWGLGVVRAVHAAFRTATEALIALGSQASASKKTAVFDKLVGELNALDDKKGCIETVEREELVARIEELGALVGLDNTDERLTGKRDW